MPAAPQSFKNHIRRDPYFHGVLFFFLLLTLTLSIVALVKHHTVLAHAVLSIAITLFLMAGFIRSYSLKVQDRVIRLEERLRLMTILPPLLHHRIAELSVPQLVALRFASDKELLALTARVFEEKLDSKQIKAAIVDWRADNFRV